MSVSLGYRIESEVQHGHLDSDDDGWVKHGPRIGIDARLLVERPTGIGRYIIELCRELDRLLPTARFYLYAPWPIAMPVTSERWIARIDPMAARLGRFRGSWLSKHLWFLLRIEKLCRADSLDVFWAQSPFVPRLGKEVRIVATQYDLQHRVNPETMRTLARWGQKLLEKRLSRADAVVSISRGTASRLHDLLGVETVSIVAPGLSELFSPRAEQCIRDCLQRYGLSRPYLFNLASWDPRKNLECLIKTFLGMKKDGLLPGYELALAGGNRGQIDHRLDGIIRGSRGIADVHALGYVPDEDLPALYAASEVFVFPSLYEGFGMPVMEARACGARVVATDLPELREAGDDTVIYIPPTEEGIRSGLLAALSTPPALPIAARSRTWRASAKTLAQVLVPASSNCSAGAAVA